MQQHSLGPERDGPSYRHVNRIKRDVRGSVRRSTFDVAGEWRSKVRLSAIKYLALDLGRGFVLISKPAVGGAQVMRRSAEDLGRI